MDPTELSIQDTKFLSCFFGPGNFLRWDALNSGEMPEASRQPLWQLISDLPKSDAPIFLPRVSETLPRVVDWYIMARNARQSRTLSEQLTAFLGPSYTDFTGQSANFDENDVIENVVAQRFLPFAFRFRVVKNEHKNIVRDQLLLIRSLRDKHPDRTTRVLRPVGRILRDFEMSLVIGDEESAQNCLDDLRSRGRLSAQNLVFLKVRILDRFQRWEEMISLPERNSLVAIRRPIGVTKALIRANYARYFEMFEGSNDVLGCIKAFRKSETSFGTLFRTRGQIDDPTVLKAFLIRTLAEEPINLEIVHTLSASFPAEREDHHWVDALLGYANSRPSGPAQVNPNSPSGRFKAAKTALDSELYDEAFVLLLDCEPTVDVVRQLLACSIELDSLDAVRKTLSVIGQSSHSVREKALSMHIYRQIWAELNEKVSAPESKTTQEAIPLGWIPWLEQLNQRGIWSNAIEVARRGSVEWGIESMKEDPSRIKTFIELLVTTRSPDAEDALRNAIPFLFASFLPDGEIISEFKTIYLNLAYGIAVDDAIGSSDLVALETLVGAVLESAPLVKAETNKNEFLELVQVIEATWEHVASPRSMDWALSVLDLFIAFNVASHTSLDQLLSRIADGFRNWRRRIKCDQWILFRQLLGDLKSLEMFEDLWPKEAESTEKMKTLSDRLGDRSIGIYTLTERIGQRASSIISQQFKSTKVQMVHDKVSTQRLVQMAKNVDILIVNTWDAKHAATNAIQAKRPIGKVILRPKSKSAGSILRELFCYLDESN